MRALAIESFESEPTVIEVPDPEPAAGEVLVRVAAASINFYDVFVASGAMRQYAQYEFPAVIGQDVAGVVEAVGDGVEGFAPGDRVFGSLGQKATVHDGTFGELAVPLASGLMLTPEGLDDPAAGTIGVAGTTALGAIDFVDPAEGATVLVVGATGGVGSFAVQIAARRDATVIASVKPGDEEFVRGLGAAEAVDYTGDLEAEVRGRWPDGVDAVVDLVNRDPAAFAANAGLVRAGGVGVSVVGGAGEASEIGDVRVGNVGGDDGLLGTAAGLILDGRIRAAITRTYPLAEAATALRDFREQHTLGKLVITAP